MENTNELIEMEMDTLVEETVSSGHFNGWEAMGKGVLAAGIIYGGYKLVRKFMAKRKQKDIDLVDPVAQVIEVNEDTDCDKKKGKTSK